MMKNTKAYRDRNHRTPEQDRRRARTKLATKKEIGERVARNRTRRRAIADGRVKKGDGKDLHHSNITKSPDKAVVQSAKKNRAAGGKESRGGRGRRKLS